MSEPLYSQLFRALLQVFYYIRFIIYIKVTELSRWLSEPTGKKEGKFCQKLAIIGDDFALGYGDNTRLGSTPGISHFFRDFLRTDNRIRQPWSIFNLGQYGSTTLDWLPFDATNQVGVKKYLDQTFVKNLKLEDCRLVVMLLGYNDTRKEIKPETTVKNIIDIALYLKSTGITTYVCTVPTLTKDPELLQKYTELNHDLKKAIQFLGDSNVQIGIECDHSNFEFRRADIITSNGTHFNAKGYKKIAKDLFHLLSSHMVRLEFQAFSKHLGYVNE